MPLADPIDRLLSPARLGGLELRNRIIKAATFEGMVADGRPTPQLTELHRRIAAGGTAMTTLAYCAPEPDGRLKQNYMHMHEGIRADLERLADAVHSQGGKLSGQVAHCGGFSQNRSLQRGRPVSASSRFNPMGALSGVFFTAAMGATEMAEVASSFGAAAGFMKSVGFDAVELHFGHGYLLSQFINPKTNRREDKYGGSIANRMRFPLQVLQSTRGVVGDDFPILAKITMFDDVPGGTTLDDSIEACRLLEAAGIDAIILSAGSSSHNPMLLFHGDSIAEGLGELTPNPLVRLGLKLVGPRLFRDYPYRELYLLDEALRIREAVSCPLVYIGGCSTVESFQRVMNEGFDFVQLGRPLIRDPELPVHLAQQRAAYVNGCTHCNRCAARIDHPDGIRCVEA